jgi:Outer membrane receptor proteins, mostly Fe transport
MDLFFTIKLFVMKKVLLFILAIVLIIPASWGQGQNMFVSGTVVSKNETPVNKIKMSVAGLPFYDITKKDGSFALDKVRSEDTIVVQLKNKTYASFLLGDCNTMKIVVLDDMIAIHREGVDTEKAYIKKGTFAFSEAKSNSVITAKMIDRMRPHTLADALKAFVPGINFKQGNIVLQAPKSISLSNDALVYLDGMESSFEHINSISVYDIERIEIDKSGYGYGARGANGVVVVNTKRRQFQ